MYSLAAACWSARRPPSREFIVRSVRFARRGLRHRLSNIRCYDGRSGVDRDCSTVFGAAGGPGCRACIAVSALGNFPSCAVRVAADGEGWCDARKKTARNRAHTNGYNIPLPAALRRTTFAHIDQLPGSSIQWLWLFV